MDDAIDDENEDDDDDFVVVVVLLQRGRDIADGWAAWIDDGGKGKWVEGAPAKIQF